MTDPSQPVRVKNVRGRVTKGPYARGTKSEREAVFIETGDNRYVLRRKDGPVFADGALDRYVDHTVTCDGFVLGTTLLAERIEKVD
jgi:hypothetical protein